MESRRKFLKQGGALALGSILLSDCMAVAQSETRIGVQLYTVRNQISESLEKTLEVVADVGYNQVELAGHKAGKVYGKLPEKFKKLLKELALSPVSGHYSTGITNPKDKGTLSNGWEEALDEMNEVGQSYAVLAYLQESERKSLDDYKRVADLLNKAGEAAKKRGIQLCYHNHAFEFEELEGQVPMYYLLDQTDPDLLKMELDLYWVTKAGFSILDFFKKYEGRIPLWHVKDIDANGDFTEVGSGSIDFAEVFANQSVSGMKHFFVEHDNSANPFESIRTSYGYIKENLV